MNTEISLYNAATCSDLVWYLHYVMQRNSISGHGTDTALEVWIPVFMSHSTVYKQYKMWIENRDVLVLFEWHYYQETQPVLSTKQTNTTLVLKYIKHDNLKLHLLTGNYNGTVGSIQNHCSFSPICSKLKLVLRKNVITINRFTFMAQNRAKEQ